MDFKKELQEYRLRQKQINLHKQLFEKHQGDSTFDKLDEGRKHDVIQCLVAIRTSPKPHVVAKARQTLATIYKEQRDPVLRDARKWYINEKAHGRYENAKNFLESVEKQKDKYNPYG